jgi:natural product precursor
MKQKVKTKKINLVELNQEQMEKLKGGNEPPNCSSTGCSTVDCDKAGSCDARYVSN